VSTNFSAHLGDGGNDGILKSTLSIGNSPAAGGSTPGTQKALLAAAATLVAAALTFAAEALHQYEQNKRLAQVKLKQKTPNAIKTPTTLNSPSSAVGSRSLSNVKQHHKPMHRHVNAQA
jgi:hypothetical protein